jgi:hypothetical protein
VAWDQLRVEIAQALGKTADEIPKPGTQEFNQTLGLLLDTNSDLAARVQAWLVQSTEPVSSQAEIASEARKAEARQRLASLFTKRDHTQPHRRRLNKPVIMTAIVAGIALLWLVGRMHSTPTPVPAAHGPQPHAIATAPTPPVPTPSQPPQAQPAPRRTAPQGTASSPPGASAPLPTPPPPLPFLPPGPAQAPAPTQPGSGGPVVVGAQGQPASDGVQVVVGAASQSAGTTVVAGTASAAGSAVPAASQGGTTVVAAVAQGQGAAPGPAQPAAQGTSAAAAPHFQVGDQFTVKLMTPLAVSPAWQALPAVAQAVDGPIAGWQVMGSATQGQDGSLQIAWTQALSPDRRTTIDLHGVAYDPKIGKPGVPGAASSVMAPQAARTALSGALGAVSQYVQDQIQAQQVQVSGITGVITSQVPPFWQVLAQQLATGFQPAPVQTGGTIVVTRVPAGTPVVVFITAAGQ